MVLFVFVVMMLNLGPATAERSAPGCARGVWIGPGAAGRRAAGASWSTSLAGGRAGPARAPAIGAAGRSALALFGPYLLGVELASHAAAGRPGRRLPPRPPQPARREGGDDRDARRAAGTRPDRSAAASCSRSGWSGVLVRRNVIFMLMSIEIMLNAAGLAFVVAGARWRQADGQVMFLFILAMAAAEVSVGLALRARCSTTASRPRHRRASSRMRG